MQGLETQTLFPTCTKPLGEPPLWQPGGIGGRSPVCAILRTLEKHMNKKMKLNKVKKIVVKRLNTRTGIKALGGSNSNNSCTGGTCYTK